MESAPAAHLPRHPLASPSSGIYFSSEPSTNQRAVIAAFVKKVGLQVLQGADLTKVSLPIEVFEPRSFLQRLPMEFLHAPRLLNAAASASTNLERFHYCVALMISGRNATADSADKPLNPCIGETYQGVFDDGSQVFAEQVSHHPPASHVLLEGVTGAWRVHGRGLFKGGVSGMAIRTHFDGVWRVDFSDGCWVEWNLPLLYFRGILSGRRCACWEGESRFTSSFGLSCSIRFHPGEGDVKRAVRRVGNMLKFWGKADGDAAVPPDVFDADVVDAEGQAVSKLEGSWTDGVIADGRVLWSHAMPPCTMFSPPAILLLPSDCTLRPDVAALKCGDYAEANRLKDWIESEKRAEKALRERAQK